MDRLMDHYRIAVDEYRFQVGLNWSRNQYLLVFNTAILAAGAALVRLDMRAVEILASLLFLVGAGAAGASVLVTERQHGYYRAARDHVREIADQLGLGGEGQPPPLRTTAGFRGERGGLKVRYAITTIILLIGAVDVVAAVYLLAWAG